MLALCFAALALTADTTADHETAIKAAAARVGPSVATIETSGGAETAVIGSGVGTQMRKGVGPTTGIVVAADGYIATSAFNFSNKPSAIFVAIPGRADRFVAKLVATDQTRMIALLKIDAADLPMPPAADPASVVIGQWAIALGRTLDTNLDHPPSVSVGIISALGRIWGKAIQTDAKVSPTNYGGPLINVAGEVTGILVPASPNGQGDTVGVEWYDSGIGFAIPFADVLKVLPKLKEGKDLRRGLFGIAPKSTDMYGPTLTIGTVVPESAAAKAGIQAGDIVVKMDGKPIGNQAQALHILGSKYEGDTLNITVKRDDEEKEFRDIVLMGAVAALQPPYLGIMPVRDDPELGVQVRCVLPESPADKAGVKAGDRVMKVGLATDKQLKPFSGRDALMTILDSIAPGSEIKLELDRGGQTQIVTAKVTGQPDAVPAELPGEPTAKKSLTPRKQVAVSRPPGMPQPKGKAEPKKEDAPKPPAENKKPEVGLIERTTAAQDRSYWLYVPVNYDPNVAHALVLWLHPVGAGGKENGFVDIWRAACEDKHIIIAGPKSEAEGGWLPSESEFVQEVARTVIGEYTVDRQRVVAHGLGAGAQMAFYLGLNARELIRGVAASGAAFTNQPRDAVPGQRVAYYVVAGGKDPAAKAIETSLGKLRERKYPVIYREVAEMGKEYLDRKTLDELVRWIDSLDKL